ncbi:MAG: universal stress protein [Bacteroidota bacterium]
MKNIFLALDFEEKALLLIEHAVNLGKCFNAKIWIVHIAAPEPDFVGFDVGPQYIRDKRAEELRVEHRYLQATAKELIKQGLDAEALLIQGPTVEMILEEAAQLEADIIVLGSHDRGFLHNALYGNTAKRLVNESKIPLYIVPI